MRALLVTIASSIGGGIGWWLGDFVGIMTAVALSAVGTGIGIYVARRFMQEYLP